MAAPARTVVILPALSPRSPTRSFPRRYEETQPALVQYLTHKRIVDLGADVHRRTLEQCAFEREIAVEAAEQAVWAQAELDKQAALEKALIRARNEHEKNVKHIMKSHKEALKQEALRVEGEMQQLAIQQVQQEREEGEQRLIEAVHKTEQRCQNEKELAVETARKEERVIAAREQIQLAKRHKEKMVVALRKADDDKQQALEAIRIEMLRLQDEAVQAARILEQGVCDLKLDRLQEHYEQQMATLNARIVDLTQLLSAVRVQLSRTQLHRRLVQDEFIETRGEFQLFIDRTRPYQVGESEYVLPAAKSLDLS